jgi:hypothetical protein
VELTVTAVVLIALLICVHCVVDAPRAAAAGSKQVAYQSE